ncbi:PLP-dependent cysteine synthase family protein [Sedimentitalea todarodis]|uniref:Cysteine synthase family protein n=1 Tax=Sedimentitalea todarodis TaxID=1631240 RepID=A0ABU3VD64_9RHOB|nr:cysteine synthase family protein [Sedimentitalea todarodis]MDU9004125.1 cysteine synthase family protein [Sedimentitalea todarodis]
MAGASIVDVIGRTPSVWLDRMVEARGLDGRILAKLDYLNPGFSKKDRAARGIIEIARADGSLAAGQTVVELTSGNMGTGLAIVCSVLGHPFVAVMSRGNSPERARMMTALGAEVVLVDQAPDSVPGEVSGADLALVEDAAQRIAASRGAFRANQFAHSGNAQAHFDTTGPELWADSDCSLTAFADFAGSGGTFGGTMKALRQRNPMLRGYVVEPEGAAALAGHAVTQPGHPIQGGGYAMSDLSLLDPDLVHGYLTISGQEARETTRALAREEGIFAGYSAGANVAAALRLLAGSDSGGRIGVVICDSGLKYLSTDLWDAI